MPLPSPPTIPATEGSGRIFIIDPLYAGSAVIYVVEPTHASGRIAVIPSQDIARDSGTILIESITQTYFQDNILNFLPYEYWRKDVQTIPEGGGDGALDAFTQVFAITLDEIKQAIDELPLILDIEHCPPRYLRVIAEMLNFPLEDVDNTAEQRRQLRTAIDWYKAKGSRKAFRAILYAFGFDTEMIPLWTEDYATFTDTIPGVAAGNDPPNDFPLLIENGGTWYRSPHYGIRLRGIVGDRHVFIEWGATPQLLIDEYEALAEEVGEDEAWYEMVDELSAAGALLRLHFDTPDFNYMHRRIEFLRPVFAVLEWLEFLTEMQEQVDDPVEPTSIMTANPVRDEKGWYLGYCDQDDIQYTRLDERLLGSNPLALTTPLAGSVVATDVVDEVTYSVASAGLDHVSGTLANAWMFPGVVFTVTIGGSPVDVEDVGEEGVLIAEGVTGVLDYLTGAWWMDFDSGYEPDNGTDIVVDYSYSTEIPPCDRSGLFPRGSSELPFPHVRDPQEGYCHPPEDLYVEVSWIPEEPYTLPLTRDGMNLYPATGPVPFIDKADFPSRGFTDVLSAAGHANTLTREFGYATRPLSVLRVEQNPSGETPWEMQADNWEAEDELFEDWGGSASSYLSLPYFHRFDDATIGATPDGWVKPPGETGVAPTVVSNRIHGWDPSRKCLHFDTDPTNACIGEFTLPDPVDATGGFRLSYWISHETSGPAGPYVGVWNKSRDGNTDEDGVQVAVWRASPYDIQRSSYVDSAGVIHSTPQSCDQANAWLCIRMEWFPSTGQLYTRSIYSTTGTDHAAETTVTLANGSGLADGLTELNIFRVYASAQLNTYLRDAWLLGFWIGAPTDSWPHHQMPTV
jgi:phage tail-like protein